MIAVVQRVSGARVLVDGSPVGQIERGLCVLASIVREDTEGDLSWMISRLLTLRCFPSGDGARAFDRDVTQISDAAQPGGLLLVSNFTVSAAMKGRRPGFDRAMPPDLARPVFARFVDLARAQSPVLVATGEFGASMAVQIENDGPVTFILDSRER